MTLQETETMTYDEWMTQAGVTVEIKFHGETQAPETWGGEPRMVRQWDVTVTGPGGADNSEASMAFPFYGGEAVGEITAATVLDCLASDAAGVENAGNFEVWAAEYGYDPDSRRAEATYRAAEKQTRDLYDVLASEKDWEDLLWNVERL